MATTWRDVVGNVEAKVAWDSFMATGQDGETLAQWLERTSAELWQASGEHRAEDWDRLARELLAEALAQPLRQEWPKPTVSRPSMEELEEAADESGCEATDGCWVEPDGICEHGHPSWLLRLGWI